jgi:hypothetical protein
LASAKARATAALRSRSASVVRIAVSVTLKVSHYLRNHASISPGASLPI